jgi:hypothetical protein
MAVKGHDGPNRKTFGHELMSQRWTIAPPGVPWRELIILPLVSLLTLTSLWIGTDAACCLVWPQHDEERCIESDPVIGSHAVPGCTTQRKVAESPWVEERWNACGNRSLGGCERIDTDAVRVVTMGTSTSWGYMVPLAQTWFVRAATELRARCGREFDAQAPGGWPDLYENAARVPRVLQLHPDVVVMIVTPFDLAEITGAPFFDTALVGRSRPHPVKRPLRREQLRQLLFPGRTLLVVEDFLYQDPDLYVSNYLSGGDRVDYLRPPLSQAWRARLQFTEGALGYMATRFQASGVPFIVILAPNEAQAELASGVARPPNVDPYALGSALAQIAARHNIVFADATRAYARVDHPQSTFYRVDGHLNAAGDAILGSVAAGVVARTAAAAGKPLCAAQAVAANE